MSTPIPPVLRDLHRHRRHLRDLQSEIDLGPRVMTAQQRKLADEEKAHQDAHDTLKKRKLKLKEDEGALKQIEDRLLKLQADVNLAGSKKEYDAKLSEIQTAAGKKGELEDAILATMTDIEERTADLPNVERRWADARAEFERYKAEAAERLERLLADQRATQEALAAAEAKLPADVKGQYQRLVKSYGPDGLAGVVGRTCQQCRMSITEQLKNNLAGGLFVTCPQCGRALYPAEG